MLIDISKVNSEVGIYKRKQENKKTRKHTLDQESDQEKKDNGQEKKHALDQESDQEKNRKLSFFLDRFLGRERVFFLYSYFLVFFYKFSPQM